VRDDNASFTAAFVAYARGLGHTLPADARLMHDPFGVHFAVPIISVWPVKLWARVARTFVVYMQVRSRTFDDVVTKFIEHEGGRQIVILGAGFDCRAVRLPAISSRTDVKVFEIDHPATQARKKRVLAEAGAVSPSTYVEWDFAKRHVREIPDALRALGHDPSKPTCTLWEGVTMYLSEEAIDASVRAVHAYSAPGSAFVFNYVEAAMLAKPSLLGHIASFAVNRAGEPFTWGWDPTKIHEWLKARDWDVEWNKGLAQLARELLPTRPDVQAWMNEHGRYTLLARRR
jgi:methyltransferase (TIGR00027 family)